MVDHQKRVYDSVLDMLSSEDNPTPLVRLHRVVPFEHTRVYAKLEWYNPFGAVKDRVAANMILDAEDKGLLGRGQKLVEPTSGNTGMGLAMMANARGYSLTTPLSRAIPLEKRTMLRFFGTDVEELDDTLCPAPGAPEGAIARATELGASAEFHMLNQYQNEANPEAHIKTTGPEIWRQTDGKITHFVAGLGTCGTITGNGRFLKSKNPAVQVLGVHPQDGHDIPGVRSLRQLSQTALFRPDEYDGLVEVDDGRAFELCRRLNQEESIIAGPSSAMALAGALELVPDAPGNLVVVIFPDNAFKYASSIARHVPGMATSEAAPAPDAFLTGLLDNVEQNPEMTIDIEAAHARWAEHGPAVIDVREPSEFANGHIPGAINVPLGELAEHRDRLPADRDAPILCVCQAGARSLRGALVLSTLGHRDVRSIEGGTFAWQERGFAVETD